MRDFTVYPGGGETSEKKDVPLQLIQGGNMIVLTNMVFRNDPFKSAFMKLGAAEINAKAFYSVKRIMDKIQQRSTEILKADADLRKEFLVDKEIENEDGTKTVTKVFIDEDRANESFKSLYSAPFEIEVSKIPLVDVEHLKFTTSEWEAISPIIDGL